MLPCSDSEIKLYIKRCGHIARIVKIKFVQNDNIVCLEQWSCSVQSLSLSLRFVRCDRIFCPEIVTFPHSLHFQRLRSGDSIKMPMTSVPLLNENLMIIRWIDSVYFIALQCIHRYPDRQRFAELMPLVAQTGQQWRTVFTFFIVYIFVGIIRFRTENIILLKF